MRVSRAFSNAELPTEADSTRTSVAGNPHPRFPPSQCEWKGCEEKKIFVRKSEFKKHTDKHERPYTCSNPGCGGATFGDKAGLQRHDREQHGDTNFLCPVPICPRHTRGFPRKRNLETHITARHQNGNRSTSAGTNTSSVHSESTNKKDDDGLNDFYDTTNPPGEIGTLKIELQELEARKEALVEDQMKVDADIQAVRRTMQLMAARGL